MNPQSVLIIGLVWPEPTSSAAGTRIIQLADLFLTAGYQVTFASAASKTEFSHDLLSMGITERNIQLNDDSFNTFLQEINPAIVLFDRFMTEEQYGWRVQQECPGTLRILDTEDLHFLRHARQQSVITGQPVQLFTALAKREVAAILRCDLSLLISEAEMDILQRQFRIDAALLVYMPFLEEEISPAHIRSWKTFEQREGFVFIGNFLHEPNWHTLQFLKTKIWPVLRKKLPNAILHIYGAYTSQKVMQLQQEKEKFLVHGRAENAREAISRHKVLIAPIQFGAGLKGKFIDAMQTGTPVLTTTTGAEAMNAEMDWNGVITDDPEVFIAAAVRLYQDKEYWLQAAANGARIINERYSRSKYSVLFCKKIEDLILNLETHRQVNFMGQLLQYHTANSTKYMSLWIAEKNKNKT